MDKKKLTENDLGDIILCEPITNRGYEALANLKTADGFPLSDKVSVDDFFNEMRICSKYSESGSGRSFVAPDYTVYSEYDKDFEYEYSIERDSFIEMKEKLKCFNRKFISDSRNQSPLLILGTAGNGKSIEARFKIKSYQDNFPKRNISHIFFNLEESLTELTYETTFRLDDNQSKNPLWLTCMTMVDGLYKLIQRNEGKIIDIVSNHQKFFIEKNSTNDFEKQFFDSINEYNSRNPKKVRRLFENIIEFINENNPNESIENILKITMAVMYCIDPNSKNYIVFDNFEYHIKLNSRYIPIPEQSLAELYGSIIKVTNNLPNVYNRILLDESWRAFKTVFVLRRASAHLIAQSDVHYANKFLGIGNDYTGHFDIWRIWPKKKTHIFDKYLSDKYDPDQAFKIFNIIDDIMRDSPDHGHHGTSYQELMAPIMNSGIRRNARSQAYTVMQVYDILTNSTESYINYDTYKKLLAHNHKVNAIRYLYRRALLEIQFRRMITSLDSQKRFEKLYLGMLSEARNSRYSDAFGKPIEIRNVTHSAEYPSRITLVRRVLSYLSNHIDENVTHYEGGAIYKTRLFATMSIFDLMIGIFLNPSEKSKVHTARKSLDYKEHYLPLACVLLSLGSMSYSETKSAPLLIIDIDNSKINLDDIDNSFASILKMIWESKDEDKTTNDKSKVYSDYRIRLTEAGATFLRDTQPSFSFFSALYCSGEYPLFFLRDVERIKFVIQSVYNSVENTCARYELAAQSFCGKGNSLKCQDYLPIHNGKYVTFKERIIQMHSNHINLYYDYIDNASFLIELTHPKRELLNHIEIFKRKYDKLRSTESNECF